MAQIIRELMNQSISTLIAGVMPIAVASGLFVSLCTIQRPSGTLTADGSPDGLYVDVSGLVNIPCMNAPTSNSNITATERKTPAEIESDNSNHCLLSAYYPIIQPNTHWRAVVDGVIYDILGAESDSQSQMTRLKLQICTV